MKKKTLVLAYEKLEDLPKNYRGFDLLDVYGFSKNKGEELKNLPVKTNYYNRFFEIQNYHKTDSPYSFCYIRHPDPWGEPRNWMQPIAALTECLQGKLVCEFWFPSEVVSFNFLLVSFIGRSSIKFLGVKQIDKVENWNNYEATWDINTDGLKKIWLIFIKRIK